MNNVYIYIYVDISRSNSNIIITNNINIINNSNDLYNRISFTFCLMILHTQLSVYMCILCVCMRQMYVYVDK